MCRYPAGGSGARVAGLDADQPLNHTIEWIGDTPIAVDIGDHSLAPKLRRGAGSDGLDSSRREGGGLPHGADTTLYGSSLSDARPSIGDDGSREARRCDFTAPTPPVEHVIRSYYATLVEKDRLTATGHGRLEQIRTMELLKFTLPAAPARILDVGGGTGVYAQWLCEAGYDVHLVDVIPEHVSQVLHGNPRFTAAVGDARNIEEPARSADAVLMLGPLYHLLNQEDRLQALREARRVLRPHGTLAAAVTSRHAAILAYASRGEHDLVRRELALATLDHGRYDPRLGFTTAYFHTPKEAVSELRQAGFRRVQVRAIEGPMWTALKACADADADRLNALTQSALICARALEDDPALLAASAHLLVTGSA